MTLIVTELPLSTPRCARGMNTRKNVPESRKILPMGLDIGLALRGPLGHFRGERKSGQEIRIRREYALVDREAC
jgi:hypothetical protein